MIGRLELSVRILLFSIAILYSSYQLVAYFHDRYWIIEPAISDYVSQAPSEEDKKNRSEQYKMNLDPDVYRIMCGTESEQKSEDCKFHLRVKESMLGSFENVSNPFNLLYEMAVVWSIPVVYLALVVWLKWLITGKFKVKYEQ